MFDRVDKQVSLLATLTKEEFNNYFQELFLSPEHKRIDLRYNSHSHKEQEAAATAGTDGTRHSSIASFKMSMGYYGDQIKLRFANSATKAKL